MDNETKKKVNEAANISAELGSELLDLIRAPTSYNKLELLIAKVRNLNDKLIVIDDELKVINRLKKLGYKLTLKERYLNSKIREEGKKAFMYLKHKDSNKLMLIVSADNDYNIKIQVDRNRTTEAFLIVLQNEIVEVFGFEPKISDL